MNEKQYQDKIRMIKGMNTSRSPTVPPPVIVFPEEEGPFFSYGLATVNVRNIAYFEYIKDKPSDPAPTSIKLYFTGTATLTIPIAYRSKLLSDIKFKEE